MTAGYQGDLIALGVRMEREGGPRANEHESLQGIV